MSAAADIVFMAACARQWRHVDADAVRHDPAARARCLEMARAYESWVRRRADSLIRAQGGAE